MLLIMLVFVLFFARKNCEIFNQNYLKLKELVFSVDGIEKEEIFLAYFYIFSEKLTEVKSLK